jgi:hypothetical protein
MVYIPYIMQPDLRSTNPLVEGILETGDLFSHRTDDMSRNRGMSGYIAAVRDGSFVAYSDFSFAGIGS